MNDAPLVLGDKVLRGRAIGHDLFLILNSDVFENFRSLNSDKYSELCLTYNFSVSESS
jgi:hypothetical protein